MSAELQAAARRSPPGPRLPSAPLSGTQLFIAGAMGAVGVAGFWAALAVGAAARAWQGMLVNLLVFLGIAQGGVVVSAVFYLTQARWGGRSMYRLAEAFIGFVVVGFVLFWTLYFGRTLLFPWILHPIAQKAAWLNTPFLFARDGSALAVMTALSVWFVSVSRRPEVERWTMDPEEIAMPPKAIRRLAPAVILCYAGVYSLVAFDLVMSLAPAWRSTLFGAYFFAGAFWSALAAIAVTAIVVGRRLPPGNIFSLPRIHHDLGKLVFAFSVFWMYLLFSQYIVIWYGDIPVETFFVVQRVHRLPWAPLSWTVVGLVWGVPFVALLGARPKRIPTLLGTVSVLGVIGIWLERYVLIVPSLSLSTVPLGWVELVITAGFLGIFILCAVPGLNLAATAAVEDGEGDTQ